MLVLHPNAGNALFNAFNKEESFMVLGLKVEDPNIDRASKEVEATRKATAASKKVQINTSRLTTKGNW